MILLGLLSLSTLSGIFTRKTGVVRKLGQAHDPRIYRMGRRLTQQTRQTQQPEPRTPTQTPLQRARDLARRGGQG